jgi:hypothetical protein
MNDELKEPIRVLALGDAKLYIIRKQSGSYRLHTSDGMMIAAFTRSDMERFARDLLRWVREPHPED